MDQAMGDKIGAKIQRIERAVALCPKDYQIIAAAKAIDPAGA